MSVKKNAWLSCYLYYNKSSADTFLGQEVRPFIQGLMTKELVEHFFFIRYGDKHGPHIRLRLKVERAQIRSELKQLISSTFPSVRFVRYVPETDRYGGKNGVAIAEEFFEASSIASLTLINEAASWTYERALGSALQLHMSMVNEFGLSRQEGASLFGHIASHYHEDNQEKIAHLENNLEPQKALLPQLRAFWEICEKHTSTEQPWLIRWQEAMKVVDSKLRAAEADHLLQIPELKVHQINQLWYLYESYIHMTNNRLGLSREDESFIAYVIQKSLERYE